MNVIDHRKFGQRTNGHSKKLRMTAYIGGIIFGLFMLINLCMFFAYQGKALPHYTLAGVAIGGKTFDEVEKMAPANFLVQNVILQKDTARQKVATADLGTTIDWNKSIKSLKDSRPLLPFFAYFGTHDVPIELTTDSSKMTAKLTALQSTFSKPSTDKRISVVNGGFAIEDAQAGYALDIDGSSRAISTAIAKGQATITVATTALPAGNNTGDLSGKLTDLQKQLKVGITLDYHGQKVSPASSDIAAWFVHDGQTMSLSDDKIGAYVDKAAQHFGVTAANRSDLITAITYVLGKNLTSNFTISAAGASTMRTYCTAVDGVSASELTDLVGKLAATYADTRGWNNHGKIAFKHVQSGCDYKVVIAAPSLMTSYGAICDDYYNCQVGNSVIVNNDRWLYATDPWNKTGQNLETYRLLIINHETGHRLGFRDNPTCPGAGQPAPVMMQQSIDLKGCTFNTWPLESELAQL